MNPKKNAKKTVNARSSEGRGLKKMVVTETKLSSEPAPAVTKKYIAPNQLVLVSSDDPFHPSLTGYFQFMGGSNGDVAVLSERPLTVQGQVMTMFSVDPKKVRVVQN